MSAAGAGASRPDPSQRLQPAATVALAALTFVTAVSFCRIFPDWAYMPRLLVVAFGTHVACAAFRLLRVPVWAAVPLGAAMVFELLAVVYYRDTTRWLFPTGDTVDFLRTDLRLVWEQFPHAITPVPSEGSFVVAVAALLALCAVVADAFAFRAYGRAEAVVPTGVVFVFTSALGTDRNRVTVAALWMGAAVLVVAVLRFTHSREESAWMGARRRSLAATMPATVVCASIVALGAGVLAPKLPGAGAEALLDTSNSAGGGTSVISPLVDIRSRLVNRSNQEVFTVVSDGPMYWRLVGLSSFDGTIWASPDEPLVDADGVLTPQGDHGLTSQLISISRLGGELVPVAFPASRVFSRGLQWAPDSQTLVAPGGLSEGDTFRIESVVVDPTPQMLLSATVTGAAPQYYELPSGLPREAIETARAVTASAATPYEKALALQNWFRTEFAYDLNVQSGHSDDAIRNFLNIRRGYCEQFAGTFAAMARALGIPARVAVGFTPGVLSTDGRYHVYGRHAHAWPEVWFDGIGWVLFEPTPGRGAPGAEYTGVAPAQEGTAADPAGTPGATTPPTTVPTSVNGPVVDPFDPSEFPPGLDPSDIPDLGGDTGGISRRGEGGGIGVAPFVALALGLAACWVAFMPRVARRWARRSAHTPAERVSAAWQRACDALFLAGAPPPAGATPVEYARRSGVGGIDDQLVGELARDVTRAVYSPRGVDESVARRCERLQESIDAMCRERTPWNVRVMTRIDPRLAVRRW